MKSKTILLFFGGIIFLLSGLTVLNAQTVTDIDGNVYNTVSIGTQVWMKENLRTTHYADGTAIPNVPDSAQWSALNVTDKAYCFYNNSSTNANTYGALYTWAAAMNGASSSSSSPSGIQGICPTGWHLPSHAEWTTLITYLGGDTIAGGKLKETGTAHWQSPNTDATNESGFTALPSGRRSFNGNFINIGDQGYWWSSTASAFRLGVKGTEGKFPPEFYFRYATALSPTVTSIANSIGDNAYRQKAGLPVRCVCNNIISGTNYLNSEAVIFYPNPANDRLYLKANNYTNAIIRIYDLQGKKVLERKVDSEFIDISNLRKGIYIAKLISPEKTLITKFIKE